MKLEMRTAPPGSGGNADPGSARAGQCFTGSKTV